MFEKNTKKIILVFFIFGFGLATAQSNNSEKKEISEGNSASSKISGLKISPKTGDICLCCNKNGISKALIFLDGKPITNENLKNIDPKTIESMEVLKNQNAIELYGEKAKDGVILVKSKKEYAKKY